METELLETMFARMGARVKVRELTRPTERRGPGIDIRTDKRGEYFDIGVWFRNPAEYRVIDIRPAERHLLLMASTERGKQKFLCGHDERHWFVCAVPGASVSSVKAAMEALQPQVVARQSDEESSASRTDFDAGMKPLSVRANGSSFLLPIKLLTKT